MASLKNTVRDTLFAVGIYRPVKKAIKSFKDPLNRQRARRYAPEILSRVHRVFEKHSDDYWLDYGTLLGFQRHGALLPGDDDLDFGVRAVNHSLLSREMEKAGMNLVKRVNVDGTPAMEQYRYRGFRFDIFYYRQIGQMLVTYLWLPDHYEMPQPYAYAHGLATLSEIRFRPFSTQYIKFYGLPFRVPEDVDGYLSQHYGDDYLIPRSDFNHSDEKNRHVVDKEHEVIFYA